MTLKEERLAEAQFLCSRVFGEIFLSHDPGSCRTHEIGNCG
ncbi:MAG TPA: hypothetical protein PLA03_00210 [Acidobacteriota bacterium]|nr:hypothetical protein [Acidobacteriota bacterium]HQO18766.1 hypothetical protein [Acidobacteriota bacterium]